MKYFLLAALLLPAAALAQPAHTGPDIVLLPRAAVEAAIRDAQAIVVLHPDLATPTVQESFGALGACLADNPVGGVVRRQGPDQCPIVTRALAERAKATGTPKPASSAAH